MYCRKHHSILIGTWGEVVITVSTANWNKNFCSAMVKMTFPFSLLSLSLLVYQWNMSVFIHPGQGAGVW